jgi:hypothetical protein
LIFDTVSLGIKEAYVLPAHSDIMKFFQAVWIMAKNKI